ncbi:PRADC1-like protein [Anopheles arabiensis]|uniref:PA domain-containing protein n=4 Tax=gambiae species complex TaxID=44542 RepID=A0A3F2YYW7_ANOGA|nr:PRADC1-like protein [Anopheles arabiensis]XP_040235946.1 PRADC1-like protein [Anopheles coluzzii]
MTRHALSVVVPQVLRIWRRQAGLHFVVSTFCWFTLISFVWCGANNLHMNDGVRTQDIIAGDVFFEILEPSALEYTYRLRPAKDFGGTFGISYKSPQGKLVPAIPADACSAKFENADELEGNIALVERGHCSFLTKAINVEAIGGAAIIVTEYDTEIDDFDYYIEMVHDNTDRDTDIPAGFLHGKNGIIIRQTLKKMNLPYAIVNIPVNLTFIQPHMINQPPWLPW